VIVSRRANAYGFTLLLATGAALLAPQLGRASSGGANLQPSGSSSKVATTHASNATGVVQPGNVTVTATGGGIVIATRASAILRNQLRFTGTVPTSDAGDTVEVERRGRQTGWVWAPTAHGTAHSNGSFTAVWPANHIGRFDIRAVVEGPRGTASRAGPASPKLTTTVYRPSIATQYGPGFYGQKTACGQTLRPSTIGVANRTLKCGTPVAIYYHGRTMIVPVIDRGPYANHADWDLTEATGRALSIAGTATIGAVSLPKR
jgi:peptidoglycan lytic transglycosylase